MYLEEHVCILGTGPERADRTAVAVALDWRGLVSHACEQGERWRVRDGGREEGKERKRWREGGKRVVRYI